MLNPSVNLIIRCIRNANNASSVKYFVWILPFLFCLPFMKYLSMQTCSKVPYGICVHVLTLNQQLHTISPSSTHLVLHGSWWGRLTCKESQPWVLRTPFCGQGAFHTSLITPESHLLYLDTNAAQDILLVLLYQLLLLYAEFLLFNRHCAVGLACVDLLVSAAYQMGTVLPPFDKWGN